MPRKVLPTGQPVVKRQVALHVAAAAFDAPAAEVHVLETGQNFLLDLHPLTNLLVSDLVVFLQREQMPLPLYDQIRVLHMAGDGVNAHQAALQVQAANRYGTAVFSSLFFSTRS